MKQFLRKTSQILKSYVYILVDPRTKEIFYVGKGSGSKRPFEHLKPVMNPASNKELKIQELKSLSLPVSLCIMLSYYARMSHTEIAQTTDMQLGTVKSHIRRGSARLRELLSAYSES